MLFSSKKDAVDDTNRVFFEELQKLAFDFASKYSDLCERMRNQEGKYIVLYAEDNDITAKIFSAAVAKHVRHFEFMLAKDGKKAIEKFTRRDGAIDLVLLDVQMPFLTGLEVLEQIRKYEKDKRITSPAKIVIISSSASYEDEAYRLGADLFYLKDQGFKVNDVKSIFETLLSIKL